VEEAERVWAVPRYVWNGDQCLGFRIHRHFCRPCSLCKELIWHAKNRVSYSISKVEKKTLFSPPPLPPPFRVSNNSVDSAEMIVHKSGSHHAEAILPVGMVAQCQLRISSAQKTRQGNSLGCILLPPLLPVEQYEVKRCRCGVFSGTCRIFVIFQCPRSYSVNLPLFSPGIMMCHV